MEQVSQKQLPQRKLPQRQLPTFSSRVFLAPMAGVSDPAYRLLCKELGAGLVYTELTNVHAIVAREQEIQKFLPVSKKEKPVAVQLFGSDVKMLEKAVKIVSPHFDIIDYNMGCPAPHITEQMACAALLQEPELTRKIFRTMVHATTKPVTVKIRAGISKPDKWQEIAHITEEEGLSMIAFHPRTVKQGYSGKADWSLIKELKDMVKIPVIGNGDVQSPEDAFRMLQETNCDYVMIGRAAMKNPFIFKQVNEYMQTKKYNTIGWEEKKKLLLKYMALAAMYNLNFANIKIHAMNFSTGIIGARKLRVNIGKCKSEKELKKILKMI